ncbi:MAG: PepSY-associated TM helix domain-containing protein [Bacteroidetes bacterium]|nr:PepSY-associated TM helix domain-containing protein [Bacteroidota bacterium]
MSAWNKTRIRRLNVALHRDLGYFFSALVVIYCISGIALNHVDDWNPDFIIAKETIQLDRVYQRTEITDDKVLEFGKLVGEEDYKLYDFPTKDQVKIYYEDATFHIHLQDQSGIYERVSRRPVFYQTNVIHRNSLAGWKWISDIFAFLLITITITGLFVLKGKYGISGRGKWFIAAGIIPPLVAIIIQAML